MRAVLSLALLVGLVAAQGPISTDLSDICVSANYTFTVKVNLYAGELGYFSFEECGDKVNPTIGMEMGKTYTFLQSDRSNYYHPMGFAYFPDGAHADQPELEPAVTETPGNQCATYANCSAPMYFLNNEYLGSYSNIPAVKPLTTGEEDFGLDNYEPLFFYPLTDWIERGQFSIRLKFQDAAYTKDIFYFCHIHEFMTGRIKLLQDSEPVNPVDEPPLGYEYDMPSEFDQACGTFGLGDFQLPNPQCPASFVCDTDQAPEPVRAYSKCIDAMNCHMFAGMTTGVTAGDEVALFIHQMIPHHQNAVNMAAALLKTGDLQCDDLLAESPPCTMEIIMRSIINTQNAQIQSMRGYLEAKGLPALDDCQVDVGALSSSADRREVLASLMTMLSSPMVV